MATRGYPIGADLCVCPSDYRNRRIGDFLKELKLTEGKATGIPVIRDEMAKNGNPEPVFYTDDEKTLFLVTLPCHLDWLVTKSVAKPSIKMTAGDIKALFNESFDLQALSRLLETDISDVVDFIRDKIVSKPGQKLSKSAKIVSKSIFIIDFLRTEQSREAILTHLGLINHSTNFKNYIKPLLDFEIIALTIPDKPNSQFQKYRLTEKGRKLLKS